MCDIGFECIMSDFGFWISDFGLLILDFSCRTYDAPKGSLWLRMADVECIMSDRISDFGFLMSDV